MINTIEDRMIGLIIYGREKYRIEFAWLEAAARLLCLHPLKVIIKGFEVVYAAGSILEFRLKVKKGVWMSDGQWNNYFVPCRFIDGDVRPYMDGQLLKPSLLLKIQKKYHYSR